MDTRAKFADAFKKLSSNRVAFAALISALEQDRAMKLQALTECDPSCILDARAAFREANILYKAANKIVKENHNA